MRLGLFLPNLGEASGRPGIRAVAQRAEELRFDSLWVTDRLLMPTRPTIPFRGSPDGRYPSAYERSLDPLVVLAYVASITERARLGTSILNAAYLNPVVVGRALTSIDVLSEGRLILGVGAGWHPDEFAAAGVPMSERGKRLDEFLTALVAIWTTNPVSHHETFFEVPESSILPKPVQKPHPQIALAVNSPVALRRAARLGYAIHPANPAPDELARMIGEYETLCARAGHERRSEVIVRAEVALVDRPIAGERRVFHGSPEQVLEDLAATARAGADEIALDPTYFVDSVDAFLHQTETLADLARRAVDASGSHR